ncbi:unnamed protein product [Enterobius vermicularis]|uniref:Uncharacterized protein n=1 Tax=Enterobius vermicularis TaxID=51028 RepID=A0A3P6ILR1_ENTVE|nr:unnamed protein product [Enterobius vermicularis]
MPKPSVEELASAGKSVLKELDLFSWWKPTSYLRWAIETIHIELDLPYWSTIAFTTVLRLALIYVPIVTQRNIAKQSKYAKEIQEFQTRAAAARKEGNSLLAQQILLEQFDFYKKKGIRYGQQAFILLANGFLWFQDLTVPDPYYILPIVSAGTLFTTLKLGVETGATPTQLAPTARMLMQIGIPVFVFFFVSRHGAVCLYWCISNFFSLFYYGLFRVNAVRSFLNIPPIVDNSATKTSIAGTVKDWKNWPKKTITLDDLRKEDARAFQKAGRAKPVIRK